MPLRIEVGPKDLENNTAVFARRDNGEKKTVEGVLTVPYIAKSEVLDTLDNIQAAMFKKAKAQMDASVVRVETQNQDNAWTEFCANLQKGHLIQVFSYF